MSDVDDSSRLADLAQAYDFDADARNERELMWRADVLDRWSRRLDAGARILELGAGTGQASSYLEGKGFELLALDLSPGNVAKCRFRGLRAVVADMGRLEDLQDPDFTPPYDAAFAINSLIHFPKDQLGKAVASIRSALRYGAPMLFTLWGGRSTEGVWAEDWTVPPRFFSLYDEDEARRLTFDGFDRTAFSTLDNRDERELYSLVLEFTAS